MVTKEHNERKICLFCASEYHLEMILLPYIRNRLKNTEFIIFTENDLQRSLDVLLEKVNLDEESKDTIKKMNWKNGNKYEEIEKSLTKNKNIAIIINGNMDYIRYINNNIKNIVNDKVQIIDCFHVSDPNVDIAQISSCYKYILNTQKI